MSNFIKRSWHARAEIETVSPASSAGLVRMGLGAANMIIMIGLLQAALS